MTSKSNKVGNDMINKRGIRIISILGGGGFFPPKKSTHSRPLKANVFSIAQNLLDPFQTSVRALKFQLLMVLLNPRLVNTAGAASVKALTNS